MVRYFILFMAGIFFAFPVYASKISQDEFERIRGECMAAVNSDSNVSAANKTAAEKCLAACPVNLPIYNNRALTLCMGAHHSFKKTK
ncbi:hypothetical protein [Zhongshania aliphaticivorans]|uniref:hypothetical protein n=1 Tax=Zhongshania aliphaticivorans TaxID=1470434 RepID=UPI0012E631F2|nr:hypothetical protein [Zhongshania aliphaticivorans]MBQ0758652.1 hypothetical protein [Zhongshania sp.]CAA0114773.1 Uncharacterised protein [Zhongshania aliphaticivorans]